MMTVGRMLPRCWSDQNGLIARSKNSIYLREDWVPLTAAEKVIECLFVYLFRHLIKGGLTGFREVKKANKTNATIPQRPDNNDNGID